MSKTKKIVSIKLSKFIQLSEELSEELEEL